jgi:hypothetical protein
MHYYPFMSKTRDDLIGFKIISIFKGRSFRCSFCVSNPYYFLRNFKISFYVNLNVDKLFRKMVG